MFFDKSFSTTSTLHLFVFLFQADVPAFADCAEIFDSGYKGAGSYLIDPTGSRNENWAVEVWCQDRWTYILNRGQHGYQQVFFK